MKFLSRFDEKHIMIAIPFGGIDMHPFWRLQGQTMGVSTKNSLEFGEAVL
jgi:hypothetical protein